MKKMYIKYWLTIKLLGLIIVTCAVSEVHSQQYVLFEHPVIYENQTKVTVGFNQSVIRLNLDDANDQFDKGQPIPNVIVDPGTLMSNNVQEPYAVHEFKVRNTPTVSVRSNNGSIKIEKSTNDRVRIEMYVTRRGLAILSTEKLEDYRFVFRQRHNNIFAEVISTKNTAWSSNIPAFDFVVYVPEETNASLITNAGNISISGIHGEMDARTSKGQIKVERTQGSIRLSTASGDVEVDSHQGIVFTNSIQGNINYNNVQGESRIKVVSGNVTLDEIRGSTLVQSTNGNIDYTARRIDQLVDLKTVVGNITARIPKTGAFSFDFHGQRVDIDSFETFVGDVQRTYITGTINGGGVPFHATSKLGNVNVRVKQ